MKTQTYISGFTLIEVVVSISIMSTILISIMGVFFSLSDVSNKTEIQRQLQTNIKSAIEAMAEDIRKYGIDDSSCDVLWADEHSFWCANSINTRKYYLWKKIDGWFSVALDSECESLSTVCYLLRDGVPLTNSYVDVRSVGFRVLWSDSMKKLSVNINISPSIKKWVRPQLIKNNRLSLQTTLSESFLKQ